MAPPSPSARRPSPPPTWEDLLAEPAPPGRELALGVELRVREPWRPDHWEPRRVRTATARALADGRHTPLVGLRPLVRSPTTARWVRTGVSWEDLRRDDGTRPSGQARWLRELHGILHTAPHGRLAPDTSEWLTLDDATPALLWAHLAAAPAVPVAIVPTVPAQTVLLAASAQVDIRIADDGSGALRLHAAARVDDVATDADTLRPIGRHGVYGWHAGADGHLAVTLAPVRLAAATARLLAAPGGIRVPADDAPRFLRRGLPRLARHTPVVPDAGVRLPDPAPLAARLTVRVRPRDAVDYAWEWLLPEGGGAPWTGADLGEGAADDPERAGLAARIRAAWPASLAGPLAATGTLRGAEAAEFVAQTLPALDALADVETRTTGLRRDYEELRGDPRIRLTTVPSTDPDWFDLGILVTVDGRTVPFRALFTALAQRRRTLLLADGGYFSLRHPALDRLRDLIDDASGIAEWETGPRVNRHHLALWEDFEDLADESEPARAWRDAVAGLRAARTATPPLPADLRADLRPYQREGVGWLVTLWEHRLGGILADDMGLGKTLQLLGLVCHIRASGERRPVLVVAPTSVLDTWRDQARRFAPGLRVAVWDSTRARREATGDERVDLVVTSYTVLRLDEDDLAARPWAAVILDEAQTAKNPATKVHRAVARLQAPARFAATGTPIENSLTDLWALLALTAPGLYPSAPRFRRRFIAPIEQGRTPDGADETAHRAARRERLRRDIRPFLLRRTKEAVARDLPDLQEQTVAVELTPAHRALYDRTLQRERQKILGLVDDLDRNRFIVFRSLTLLRMLSLDAALIDPAHARIASAKLDELVTRVAELAAAGHRCLVFSQFTTFLTRARDRLEDAGIRTAYLDGTTRRRGAVVDAFRGGDAPAFLISLKAGGFGLTVTEADYVFLLDPWWNPAVEAQARGRAHRIGQTRTVFAYRLISAGTIEEKVVRLQRRKARLKAAVLDDGDPFAAALTADDIRALLAD